MKTFFATLILSFGAANAAELVQGVGTGITEQHAKLQSITHAQAQCSSTHVRQVSAWKLFYASVYSDGSSCPGPYDVPESCNPGVYAQASFECL